MTRRRGTASLVASPVLVGAVTVLVTIIAVFIAYNANAGLPFVPTYDLKAELPSGQKLVKGNEVRVGGFRVGVVDEIKPKLRLEDGERTAIAQISMKLDKVVEPLARDSSLVVRPRSALGLKYVELTPGQERAAFRPGDTIPLRQAREEYELEDLFATFDEETRVNSRVALEGFGNALAGRGQSLNRSIESLRPFFKSLRGVMANLAAPETGLRDIFRELGRAAAQAAPVARTQARLFTNMADTFAALSRSPRSLQAFIEKSPPTLDVAIRSFRVQRPFLADFADLSRRLRPAVQELPRSLPAINRALAVGTPILPRTVALNRRLEGVFDALRELGEEPATLLALQDLTELNRVAKPLLQGVAPYQTVCNHGVYFLNWLGEHISMPGAGGTLERILAKTDSDPMQPNRLGNRDSFRFVDVPADQDPRSDEAGEAFHGPAHNTAVTPEGRADCQTGQFGYPNAYGVPNNRYLPSRDPSEGGGNHYVIGYDYFVGAAGQRLQGSTFKGRALGIDGTEDVDASLRDRVRRGR